jgi:trehalose 6-phosphate phosphatase
LSREASRTPEPDQLPAPLPRGLITNQLARGHLLLCFDFDGTVSELTNDPWQAVPLPRAKTAIAELARHPEQLTLAIISGRDLETLLRLLGLRDGLLFAGTHGLEFIGRDGERRFATGIDRCAQDIERVREFLAHSVPKDRGFIIEDKHVALTINYRNAQADDAREAVAAFDHFVNQRPTLQLLHGKMVHEAIPRGIGGKGAAIEFFLRDTGAPGSRTIYFGDDLTDEDAFRALLSHGGIGVLVGAERQSFAQYRVDGPTEVADVLEDLVAALAVSRPLSF